MMFDVNGTPLDLPTELAPFLKDPCECISSYALSRCQLILIYREWQEANLAQRRENRNSCIKRAVKLELSSAGLITKKENLDIGFEAIAFAED